MATILVTDDEPAVRTFVGALLADLGHRVLLAESPKDALALAAAERVDLLVTDVAMPGGGGRALAERVAERHPRVAVLFVSGGVDDPVLARRIEAGAVSFLAKPFAPAALVARVDALLGPAAAGEDSC